MMNPSINPQHTTSFEQLRQIVSTTSPNSKPRRHRQNLHATRSAETESHAEELTGNDSEVFANQPASVHHVSFAVGEPRVCGLILSNFEKGGTGSSDQTADTRYPSEDTPRRRRQRVDFPPHSSIMAIPELPTQSSRTKRPWEVSDQARQAARQSVHEKTQIPPERYSTFEQRRHIPGENIRPESLASSISTTESQHSRSDFFDTAPPSDLDLRFPALSPQPSPLNSRRRRGSRQGRGVIDGDAESERDKTDVGVLETQEESAAVPSSNLHIPDIDLRWQSTKRLVDDYINSRRNRSANASPDISNHEETPIHQASQVRLEHQVEDSTTLADMANFSNRAVVDRLDTVTGEVRALRHQVTELQSMLDMMVSGRSGAIETTRKTVTGRNPSGDSQPEEGASFSKLPSPVSSPCLVILRLTIYIASYHLYCGKLVRLSTSWYTSMPLFDDISDENGAVMPHATLRQIRRRLRKFAMPAILTSYGPT